MLNEQKYQAYFEEAQKAKTERATNAANARWNNANASSSNAKDANASVSILSNAKNANSNSNSNSNSYSNNASKDACIKPFAGKLGEAFDDWLAYKTEKRQSYKPTGLKALISEIKRNAERYGEEAVIEIMRKSMASNWQGIAFDRLQWQKNEPAPVERRTPKTSDIERTKKFLEEMRGSKNEAENVG